MVDQELLDKGMMEESQDFPLPACIRIEAPEVVEAVPEEKEVIILNLTVICRAVEARICPLEDFAQHQI
jgi:hypothetical protein